jgi:hypothetical protein
LFCVVAEGGECEAASGVGLDVDDGFVGVDFQIELLDYGAEVGEVLFAGAFHLVGGLKGDACYGDALVAGEEAGLRGEPADGVADLFGIEVDVGDAGALERYGEFYA